MRLREGCLKMVCDDLYFTIVEKLKEKFPNIHYMLSRSSQNQIMHADITNSDSIHVTLIFFDKYVKISSDPCIYYKHTDVEYYKPTFFEDLEYEINKRLF